MGRIYNKDANLESHKLFPYVAWGIVFLFSFFVYTLVTDLQAVAGELAEKNQGLKEKTSVDVADIEDFGY